MELVREETRVYNVEAEAQKHNALISERYKRLQNMVATQLAENTTEEQNGYVGASAPAQTSLYVSPNAVNAAAYTVNPTVTEYKSLLDSDLFTTKRFERMQPTQEAPVQQAVISEPVAVTAPVESVEMKREAQYSLSSMAKVAIAVFTFTVVAMLTLISANTYAINQKQLNIQSLETRRAELVEQNAQLQRRIEDATSEETIREYAESQGMVQKGNE